jgi:epoxyqueuosine reductase
MPQRLLAWAHERGYRVAWGPIEAAALAVRDVAGRHAAGEIDREFFDSNLAGFSLFEAGRCCGDRVLVVVMPRPAHSVSFDIDGRPHHVVIPPTYVRYRPLFDELARDIKVHALPPGSRVERVNAPLKSLAARLGLVRYGRNNLTYDPQFGTSIQLFGYVTDAPLPVSDGWRPSEPELLPECESCTACRDACPTGAIGSDRVLLLGERCLTWWNERDVPWPAWLPLSAHHCLVGCLACQDACPANVPLAVADTGVTFSPEETRAILEDDADPAGRIRASIRVKLDRIGLSEERVIGRSLRALLANGSLARTDASGEPVAEP